MKRSNSLKLAIMATTSVAVAGCTDGPTTEGVVYTNEQQCMDAALYTGAECKSAFIAGIDLDKKTAPRYEASRVCEDQHGSNACFFYKERSAYSPNPYGYLLTAAIGGASSVNWQNSIRPLYYSRKDRRYYTSHGYWVSRNSNNGKWETPEKSITQAPKPAKIQTRTSVASRGGFGSRSGGFGG